MKKVYQTPKSINISVAAEQLLAGSLGVNNDPKNGVSGDAKGMNSDWED